MSQVRLHQRPSRYRTEQTWRHGVSWLRLDVFQQRKFALAGTQGCHQETEIREDQWEENVNTCWSSLQGKLLKLCFQLTFYYCDICRVSPQSLPCIWTTAEVFDSKRLPTTCISVSCSGSSSEPSTTSTTTLSTGRCWNRRPQPPLPLEEPPPP